jgi:ABC-type glutathione transport system ATPase component
MQTVNPTRVRLAIEVPFDHLDPDLATEHQQTISGYVGRLPFQTIDQDSGATVLPRTVEHAILTQVLAAAREHNLRPMSRADIEVEAFTAGQPLRFTAFLDRRPAITLPDPSSITITIDPIAVTDIQKIIFHLKERGIGVLITDHNVRETLRITDRAYIVHDGAIFRSSTPYASVMPRSPTSSARPPMATSSTSIWPPRSTAHRSSRVQPPASPIRLVRTMSRPASTL